MTTTYDQTKDPYFQGGEGTPNRTSATVVTELHPVPKTSS